MRLHDRLHELIEPIVDHLDLQLFDLQYAGGILSVLIQRPRTDDGPRASGAGAGVDIEAITAVTRAVSRALDDADPIAGHYSLEVSSPGLERPLRTPAHFAGAVGETVSIKTLAGYDGPRRIKGELLAAPDTEDGAIEVRPDGGDDTVVVALADIEKVRTVFDWGPQPKPGDATKPAKPGRAATRPAVHAKTKPAGAPGDQDDEKKVTTS